MADARFYRKALEDVGRGVFAWMQPDGSWGYSNAGLITDGDECLLVDTLFDLALTREMLAAMRDATPAARLTMTWRGASATCSNILSTRPGIEWEAMKCSFVEL